MENPYAPPSTKQIDSGELNEEMPVRLERVKSGLKLLLIAAPFYIAVVTIEMLYGSREDLPASQTSFDSVAALTAAPLFWLCGFFIGLFGLSSAWRGLKMHMGLRILMFILMLTPGFGLLAMVVCIACALWFLHRYRDWPGPSDTTIAPESHEADQ